MVAVQALDEVDHGDDRVGPAVGGFAARAQCAGLPAACEQRVPEALGQCGCVVPLLGELDAGEFNERK